MTLTHGGLFEGYGGTTMAAAQAFGELDTRWVSDIKPASIALLEHHHPHVPNLGDLTAIDFTAVEPVDVMTASWPCQPHSSAGKRLGEADPRALWPYVHRAIRTVRPRYFCGENVARIAGNGELQRVVRQLAHIGYVGAWRCITASSVGAPHKRDRCFVVAVRNDTRPDAAVHHSTWCPPGDRVLFPTPTVRDGRRGAGWGHEPGRPLSETIHRLVPLLPTPTQNMTTGAGTSGRDGGLNLQTAAVRLLPTPSASNYGTNQGGAAGRVGVVRESLDTMARKDRFTAWGVYEPAIRQWESILDRPAPAPTQPSLRAPHGPQLSPRFVEWMMGLPAGWVTDVDTIAPKPSGLRNAALSLLGDGVVPQQGAAAFAACLADITHTLTMPA